VWFPVNFLQLLAFSIQHILLKPPSDYLFNNSLMVDVSQPITPFDLTNFTEEDARLGVSMQAIVDRYLTGTISLDSSVYSLFNNVPVKQIVMWSSCLV
jgi:hypothetical protein